MKISEKEGVCNGGAELGCVRAVWEKEMAGLGTLSREARKWSSRARATCSLQVPNGQGPWNGEKK